MRCKQIAAMGVVGALLGAGSLLATTGGASAAVPTRARAARCVTAVDDAWPSWTNGRPVNVDAKTAAGVFM